MWYDRSPRIRRSLTSWGLLLGLTGLIWGAGCASSSSGASGKGETAETESSTPSDANSGARSDASETSDSSTTLRVATFNASLHGDEQGELLETLGDSEAEAPRRVAEIIQRVRPDVLLINEFDRVPERRAVERFQSNFLSNSQGGADPIDYPHVLVPRVNTGVHSGYDLDNDGEVVSTPGSEAYAGDAFGYGEYPGQYGMVLLSKHPFDREAMRSFRTFSWHDMPDSAIPEAWYDDDELADMRLSSKTHLDVPVQIGDTSIHVLASHPTPPAFGGPENRNKRRNHDEIRFWRDYLSPERSDYIVDDSGTSGGLAEGEPFVLLGDLNADPNDGGQRSRRAVSDLIEHPRMTDPAPTSEGGPAAAQRDGEANTMHSGDPALDTADFADDGTGNLRVDYALPSRGLEVRDSSVFWPAPDEDHAELVDVSDHRLVWVDVVVSN